jgi:spore germination protein KB
VGRPLGLEKGRISETQLTMLIISFLLATALLFSPSGEAGHDSWIALLLGMGEALLFALLYAALAARFSGRSLTEVFSLVYGVIGGRVVLSLFLWYLFHLGAIVLTNFSYFLNTLVLIETPSPVIIFSIALVSIYAARHGLEVLARCSQVLLPSAVFLIIVTFVLLLKDFQWEFFHPVLEVSARQLLFSAHTTAAFPFGESVAFLLAIPALGNGQKLWRPLFFGILISGGILVMNAVQNTGILGNVQDIMFFPSFKAVREINIGLILTRVEVIVAVNFLTLGFLKVAYLLYGVILGAAEALGLRDYRVLGYPLGILIALLSLLNFSGIYENFEFAARVYPFYALPFQVGIPLLTLVIALIRRLPREGRES